MDAQTKERYEKIASMLQYGIDQADIARALGLTESRLSQIVNEDEDFARVNSAAAAEAFEQQRLINEGWDGVEALALNTVIKKLQISQDADYALKAATLANRATRRGDSRNLPIGQGAGGGTTVVTLQLSFINRLQEMQSIEPRSQRVLEHKRNDFMAPDAVERIFEPAQKKLEDAFDGVSFTPAVVMGD